MSHTPSPLKARAAVALAISAFLGALSTAHAGDMHEVRMITDPDAEHFAFDPELLRIAVGDKVHFVAENRMQSSRSIPGMLPEGAARWNGPLGHSLTITFAEPGVYGFKCPAYYRMGMVGLVIVGDAPTNLAQARAVRHPDAAAQRFERLFELADCITHASDSTGCAPTQ